MPATFPPRTSTQSTAGNDVWYDLKVHLANGRSVTAGSATLKPEAEWFRAELKKDLGIRD